MQKLSCIDNFKWLSVTISDIAIITVTNVDSRYIILSISKYEAINLIKNSVLEYCGSFSLLKTVFFLLCCLIYIKWLTISAPISL